ncbi:MAG: zinc ribbon domain-containing protein [Clostridiales bacterium]|jgi:hypothetical protein|nr:zinc ribbon domain-containing protein [Clostridiales bacterium]
MSPNDSVIFGIVMEFILMILVVILIGLASQIMLALSVYNDARYRGDNNATLWAVLTGFFNIVGLVYLIVQLTSKKFLYCGQCGRAVPLSQPVCPACGAPSPEVYRFAPPQQREKQKRNRWIFLWLFVGLTVVTMVATVAVCFHMISSIPAQYWH